MAGLVWVEIAKAFLEGMQTWCQICIGVWRANLAVSLYWMDGVANEGLMLWHELPHTSPLYNVVPSILHSYCVLSNVQWMTAFTTHHLSWLFLISLLESVVVFLSASDPALAASWFILVAELFRLPSVTFQPLCWNWIVLDYSHKVEIGTLWYIVSTDGLLL